MARFGDDELIILRHAIASENDVAPLAERVLALLVPAFLADERTLHVTASIGPACSPMPAPT